MSIAVINSVANRTQLFDDVMVLAEVIVVDGLDGVKLSKLQTSLVLALLGHCLELGFDFTQALLDYLVALRIL